MQHGIALLRRQCLVSELVRVEPERPELPPTTLDEKNQPLFFRQHIVGREPAVPVQVLLDEFIPQKSKASFLLPFCRDQERGTLFIAQLANLTEA